MVGHRYARAVDHQRPLVPLALLIVWEGGGARHGAEQEIVGREELRPRESHAVTRFVGGEPISMREHGAARRARVVAFVVGRERARDADVLLEVRVALPVGRRRAQERRVDAERFTGVDRRARALVHSHLLPAEKVAERLQPVLHLVIHRDGGGVEHQRDLVIEQALLPRWLQLQLPARRLDRVRPGHDGERQREIVAAARERPDDVDVDRRALPRQCLPVTRHDPPRGLVTVHAAEVRGVADRRADVTAGLEPGEPGRERSGGASR